MSNGTSAWARSSCSSTFDPYLGFTENEWVPGTIATLEFVLPSAWFGSDRNARLFGRPAIDLQMAYEAELVKHRRLHLRRHACRRRAQARLAVLKRHKGRA